MKVHRLILSGKVIDQADDDQTFGSKIANGADLTTPQFSTDPISAVGCHAAVFCHVGSRERTYKYPIRTDDDIEASTQYFKEAQGLFPADISGSIGHFLYRAHLNNGKEIPEWLLEKYATAPESLAKMHFWLPPDTPDEPDTDYHSVVWGMAPSAKYAYFRELQKQGVDVEELGPPTKSPDLTSRYSKWAEHPASLASLARVLSLCETGRFDTAISVLHRLDEAHGAPGNDNAWTTICPVKTAAIEVSSKYTAVRLRNRLLTMLRQLLRSRDGIEAWDLRRLFSTAFAESFMRDPVYAFVNASEPAKQRLLTLIVELGVMVDMLQHDGSDVESLVRESEVPVAAHANPLTEAVRPSSIDDAMSDFIRRMKTALDSVAIHQW